MRKDLYQQVPDRIIDQMERGVVPWNPRCRVRNGLPRNYSTKKDYRGINVFLLGSLGLSSPDFMTFIQAKELGGHVRKGEKGFLVVKYGTFTRLEESTPALIAESAGEESVGHYLKGYTVFNVSQIGGIEFPPALNPPELPLTERTAKARTIVNEMPNPPEIRTGGNVPFYCPPLDFIQMPKCGFFRSEEAYFSTLFHELGHSVGSIKRLARKCLLENRGYNAAGNTSRKIYAEEELVAEMTSAFLSAHAEISGDELPNSAAYLKGWIDALKSKDAKGWIIRAASQAQKAAAYILNVAPPQ